MRRLAWILVLVPVLLAQEAEPESPAPEAPPQDNPIVRIMTSKGGIDVELFADEAPVTVANFIGLAEGTKEFKDAETDGMVKRPFYDGLVFHRVIANFMIQGGCPQGNGSGGPGFRFEDEISARSLGLDRIKVLENNQPGHPTLQVRNQQDFQRNVIMPIIRKMGIDSDAELQARMEEVNQKLQATIPELTVMEALENLGYKYDNSRSSHAPNKGCLAMANSGPNTNGSQFFINLVDTPWLMGRHTVFGRVVKGMEVVEAIGAVETGEGDRPVEEVRILSIRRVEAEPQEETGGEEESGDAGDAEGSGDE